MLHLCFFIPSSDIRIICYFMCLRDFCSFNVFPIIQTQKMAAELPTPRQLTYGWAVCWVLGWSLNLAALLLNISLFARLTRATLTKDRFGKGPFPQKSASGRKPFRQRTARGSFHRMQMPDLRGKSLHGKSTATRDAISA